METWNERTTVEFFPEGSSLFSPWMREHITSSDRYAVVNRIGRTENGVIVYVPIEGGRLYETKEDADCAYLHYRQLANLANM